MALTLTLLSPALRCAATDAADLTRARSLARTQHSHQHSTHLFTTLLSHCATHHTLKSFTQLRRARTGIFAHPPRARALTRLSARTHALAPRSSLMCTHHSHTNHTHSFTPHMHHTRTHAPQHRTSCARRTCRTCRDLCFQHKVTREGILNAFGPARCLCTCHSFAIKCVSEHNHHAAPNHMTFT